MCKAGRQARQWLLFCAHKEPARAVTLWLTVMPSAMKRMTLVAERGVTGRMVHETLVTCPLAVVSCTTYTPGSVSVTLRQYSPTDCKHPARACQH